MKQEIGKFDRREITEIFNKPFSEQIERIRELGSKKDFLFVGVGGLCSNECIFCYKPKGDEDFLYAPVSYYEKLIKENKCMGIKKALVAGIETFAHPRVFEVIKLLKDNGFNEIEVMTTAEFFASENFGKDIANLGITSISTSLYGINFTHDNIVRRRNSFKMCIKGVLNLKNFKGLKIYIHTLLLKQNLKEIKALSKLMEKLDLPFAVLHPRPKGDENWYKDFMPSYTEIIKEFEECNLNFISFPLCILKKISIDNFNKIVKSKRNFDKQLLYKVEDNISDVMFAYSRYPSVKIEKCEECTLKDICCGPFPEYVKVYGDKEIEAL